METGFESDNMSANILTTNVTILVNALKVSGDLNFQDIYILIH